MTPGTIAMRPFLACTALCLLIPARLCAQGSDWPKFLGPLGTSVSTETGILSPWPKQGPRIVWQRKLGTGYGARRSRTASSSSSTAPSTRSRSTARSSTAKPSAPASPVSRGRTACRSQARQHAGVGRRRAAGLVETSAGTCMPWIHQVRISLVTRLAGADGGRRVSQRHQRRYSRVFGAGNCTGGAAGEPGPTPSEPGAHRPQSR